MFLSWCGGVHSWRRFEFGAKKQAVAAVHYHLYSGQWTVALAYLLA
jgi:hypothetical protein